MLVRFADEWTSFLPAGAIEPIRHDLGLSYAQAGIVLAALPAGGLLGNLFNIAADHVSRRWLATLGAAGYGAAMIAFGAAHSLLELAGAAFVWGAASDALTSACEVTLVDLSGDRLPGALARMNALASLGDLLGPATLAIASVLAFGWRSLFEGSGVMMLAYGAWLGSQEFPPPHPAVAMRRPMSGVIACLRDRRVVISAILLGLFGVLDEPLVGFTIAYLERVRGFSPAEATMLAMAEIAGALAGFSLFDRLARGRAGARLLSISTAVMICGLPAMVFAPGLVGQVFGAVSFGAAGAVFYARLQGLVLGLRPGQAGATSAVVAYVGMLGLGFPMLAGWVSDAWGLPAGLALYCAVPVILAALVMAAPQRIFRAPLSS